ncbi:MAG: hypothetical protein CL441_01935 [Acidimicrobiaceae bacterium]|nr:hypothetical protein [Acidimicrobiaceae bacterium]
MSGEHLTRQDLEAGVREVLGDTGGRVEAARVPLLAGAAAVSAVLLGAAFLVGRRLGRRSSTTVEIRRI